MAHRTDIALAAAATFLIDTRVSNRQPSITKIAGCRSSRIRKRIRSFQDLPVGWHYGVGVMIPDHVRDGALEITEVFESHEAEDIEAFPCADGGVLVSGYRGKRKVDVLCRPCGMLDISLEEDGILQEDRTDQNLGDLETFLKGLMWEKKSFVYSTRNNSVSAIVGSRVPPLGNPRMVGFSPSIETALTAKASPNAPTSRGIIKTSPDIPPLYGTLISMNFPLNAVSRMSHQRAGIPVTETSAA